MKRFLPVLILVSIFILSVPAFAFEPQKIIINDNIYVAGSNGSGFLILKISPKGIRQWSAHYFSGEGEGTFGGIVADNCDNVYVTGSMLIMGKRGYVTIKYAPTGEQLWVARYDGGDTSVPYAIAVDSKGNTYVTGKSVGVGWDCLTIKYAPTGEQLWVAHYNGQGNSFDEATGIVIDSDDNIYVAGSSFGQNGTADYLLIKYAPTGEQLWVARYNGPADAGDWANAISLDSAGNICITGTSTGQNSGTDFATIKYAPTGEQLWVARYNGEGNFNDGAISLAIDSYSNVFITGYSWGEIVNALTDYTTIKYAPTGEQLWVARYNGDAYFSDEPADITLDLEGNAYVTGFSYGQDKYGRSTSRDFTTVKYSFIGEQLWVVRYNRPEKYDDYAKTVAADKIGGVYVAGYNEGVKQGDFAIIKYESITGKERWILKGGHWSEEDIASGVNFEEKLPLEYLNQNYPNPFNPTTKISFELSVPSEVKLTIYNSLSQEVACLADSYSSAGKHSVQWNARDMSGGVYFYRLTVGGESTAVRKMLLLK